MNHRCCTFVLWVDRWLRSPARSATSLSRWCVLFMLRAYPGVGYSRGVLLLTHHFPGLVGDFLDRFLHFAGRLVDVAFALQVLVVSQIADTLLDAALRLVYLACH